nr:interleukin-22 receptor subunit alpha-2 [Nothobranchius furzeri]
MTHLLLATLLLQNLSLSITTQEMLVPPSQVMFKSADYRHVLHWTPPTNSSSLHYDVQWKIYGEPVWLDVEGCQGIQKHHCDLSRVTKYIREWYYARVRASSGCSCSKSSWALSPRFSPCWDTQISPPSLKLNTTKQGIVVHVKPSRVLARNLHKQHSLLYNIYTIHANGSEDVSEITSNERTLTKLDPNTKYCFQAQVVIPRLFFKSSLRSSTKCTTTP